MLVAAAHCARRSLCGPRFQVGFGHSFLGTDCNRTTISRGHETGSTLSAVSIDGHRFSAFWLRSSMGLSSKSFENFLHFASRITVFFLLSELLVFSPSHLDCFGIRNKLFSDFLMFLEWRVEDGRETSQCVRSQMFGPPYCG